MANRTGNDRSVKTIKFLEQYAKLCLRHERQIDFTETQDLVVRRIDGKDGAAADAFTKQIESLPEA